MNFSIKSNRWQEKCEIQLKQILSTFANLTDSLHLILTIESKSGDKKSISYQLIIDDEESMISIPGFAKDFPLEVRLKFISIQGFIPHLPYVL